MIVLAIGLGYVTGALSMVLVWRRARHHERLYGARVMHAAQRLIHISALADAPQTAIDVARSLERLEGRDNEDSLRAVGALLDIGLVFATSGGTLLPTPTMLEMVGTIVNRAPDPKPPEPAA